MFLREVIIQFKIKKIVNTKIKNTIAKYKNSVYNKSGMRKM